MRIAGEVSDAALAAYFGAADAFLSMSRHEGFGVPLVEAMAAGVPIVTRDAGAVGQTVAGAALVLEAGDPAYVAAALHRACTDEALRRHLITAGRRRAAELSWRRGRHPARRRHRRGGGAVREKVAFVTPRYGTQIMGGAETAVRKLAEHLGAMTSWETEVHTTCALDPHTWADELEPGTTELQRRDRAPTPDHAGAPARLLRLDGLLRLAPRQATRAQGKRWVEYNGPVSSELVEAVCASDADVVAFTPYLYHPTVATIGRVPMPAVFHPAAHDEPALYFSVFRGTFDDADAFCFYTRGRAHAGRAHVPGGGAAPDRARPRHGRLGGRRPPGRGACSGWATGRTSSAWGGWTSTRAPRCSPRSSPRTRSAIRARSPWPWSGPVSFELPPHPDIVVTGPVDEADKWDIVRDALVAISPSALESFSLVVIEAWVDRVPVLVNGACGPTREHAERSGGACGSPPTPSSRRC